MALFNPGITKPRSAKARSRVASKSADPVDIAGSRTSPIPSPS
ncbi:hypothetical protein [Paramuribaculum intestinale]|nr:hypothetical protein [Paramuribaculum intestinale]